MSYVDYILNFAAAPKEYEACRHVSDSQNFQALYHVSGGHDFSGRHCKPCKTRGATKQNDNHDAASHALETCYVVILVKKSTC